MTIPAVSDWSTTAASNVDVGGINIQGSGNVSQADDAMRTIMKQVAALYDSLGAVNTVAGTASAITATIAEQWTAYATGQVLAIKLGSAITGATTLNVTPSGASALGAKAIRSQADAALAANDGIAGGTYFLRYDATFNSAAGAWVLLNPAVSVTGAFSDSAFRIQDNGDATKQVAFETSGITTATTRTLTVQNVNGTIYVSGGTDVPVADGGTGVSSITANSVILGNGTSAIQEVAPSTSGNVLTSNGTTWQSTAPSTGQPIPTSSTMPVGACMFCRSSFGGAIAAGATLAGSSLRLATGTTSSSLLGAAGAIQTGTWRNDSGTTIDASGTNNFGYFTRTA